MFARTFAAAFAAAALLSMTAPASAEAPARCEAASFRVYFAHNSSRLGPAALETMDAAARQLEACGYAELRVSVDASSPLAARRADNIRAAAQAGGWATVRVAPALLQQANYAGPDYVEMTMAPDRAGGVDEALPQPTVAGA